MGEDYTNSIKKIWKNSTVKIATGLLLAAGVGMGSFFYQTNYKVDSIIYLDGTVQNSSIEIKVNQKEKVLEVNAKDTTAQEIIGEKDFQGSSLDVTMNVLLTAILQNDSFYKNGTEIKVRVESKNLAKGQRLQDELNSEINKWWQVDLSYNSLEKQTRLAEEELIQLASDYGITVEKAQIIQEIREQNTDYTFEDLAARPVQELQLLQGQEVEESNSTTAPVSFETTEEMVEKNTYIDEAKAKAIAVSHASVQEDMITKYYAKLDYEDGIQIYEIEFHADGYEYEYDINAVTGEIVSQKKEYDRLLQETQNKSTDSPQTTKNQETIASYITEADAKTAAFTHAGVAADQVWLEKCKQDYEDGIMVYEIKFRLDGYEYEYDINAVTGEIISQKKEKEYDRLLQETQNKNTTSPQTTRNQETTASYITEADAKTAAFTHAGVAADQVWLEKCKQDYEDGIMVYEIEFRSDGYEYEYEINAQTGEVVQFKREVDHAPAFVSQNNENTSTSYISELEAREIAISYAGLKEGNDARIKIELEEEDGILVYEVEIVSGGYEYKCDIHAVTGEVLDYEKEKWD